MGTDSDKDPGAQNNDDQGQTFEQALRQLEQIVEELERGESGLTESLSLYAEGVRLLTRCHAELNQASRSVALLTGVDEPGEPLTAPFDASATATAPEPGEAAPASKPRKRRAATPPPDDDPPFIPF
jgi:exodeoxyribonuclease VII small subunit